MELALEPRHWVLLVFIASALYAHLRGTVRFGLVRALTRTATDYFATLKASGSTNGFRDRMLDFDQLNGVLGTQEYLAMGKRYE
mgnify:CR=1 FL=1